MPYSDIIFIDKYSLLVSTEAGLKRINCPFKVRGIFAVDDNISGDVFIVHEIREGADQKLVYLIQNREYDYKSFEILFPQ